MDDEDTQRLNKLKWGIERSIRYHDLRRAFFDRTHKIVMFLVIIFGSGAMMTVAQNSPIMQHVILLLIICASALDLTFSMSIKAREHNDFYKQWHKLLITINRLQEPSNEDVMQWENDRRVIETDEPTIYRVVDVICHNQLIIAHGIDSSELRKITWCQRLLANLYTFPNARFDIKIESPQ